MTGWREVVERARVDCDVPGMSVALVTSDGGVVVEGLGSAGLGRAGVDGATAFPIASCTKAFTSTVVATFVDDGVLAWDTPVREYLPDLRMWDPAATDQLTLRDMLAHRSGLPRHDHVWFRNETSSRKDVVDSLRHLQPSQPFRAGWQYNNVMYLAAGRIVEAVSGTTWEDALQARILDPLDMTSTAPAMSRLAPDAPLAGGHVATDGRIAPMPFSSHELGGPAGSVVSTARDLATWMQACLAGSLVSRESARELRKPAMVLPAPVVTWPELTKTSYALGWDMIQYRGHRGVQHGGNTDGYSSMITLLPDEGIGVAVLSNLHISPIRDIASYLVLDTLLGATAAPWTERFQGLYDASFADVVPTARRRRARPARSGWHRPVAEYAGAYAHPAYGTVTVEAIDGELSIQLRELDLVTRHVDHDAFELYDDARATSIAGTFVPDVLGGVRAVSLVLEPAVEPIEFVRSAPQWSGDAKRLAGRYGRGPVSAVVTVGVGDVLWLAVGPGPRSRLEHRRDLEFGLAGSAHATVEFLAEPDHPAEALVLSSTGTFTRVD